MHEPIKVLRITALASQTTTTTSGTWMPAGRRLRRLSARRRRQRVRHWASDSGTDVRPLSEAEKSSSAGRRPRSAGRASSPPSPSRFEST